MLQVENSQIRVRVELRKRDVSWFSVYSKASPKIKISITETSNKVPNEYLQHTMHS